MFGRDWLWFLDEGAGGGTGGAAGAGGSGAGDGNGSGAGAQSYDAWLASQPAEIKSLVDGHIGGLKTALGAERERNKELEKNLREAASKADKGSDNERRLTEMANQVAEASRKTAFYEGAVTAGVANVKLAFMAAVSDDLFKKDGSVDFETLKKNYPELFRAAGSNNAGTGGRSDQETGRKSMDAFIRSRVNGGG